MFRALRTRLRDERRAAGGRRDDQDVRVLVGSRPPAHAIKYVDQLIGDDSAGGAPGGAELEFRHDLTYPGEVDVVHLIDSSSVIGDRRTPEREQIRRARRFVKVLARKRIALVRTLVTHASGEPSPSAADVILHRATAAFITVDPVVTAPAGHSLSVVPHSHFRDRFLGYPAADAVPGRLLFIAAGTLPRAYEAPLKVFAIADLPRATLRIVGAVNPALEASFARTVGRHAAKITLCADPLSDAARVTEVSRAELIIAAAPDSLETLSLMMLALSLDRPVLVESTPSTRALAEEVGREWVRLHEGPLTAATLEAAVITLHERPPTGQPNLGRRDPNAVAQRYVDIFRAAAASLEIVA